MTTSILRYKPPILDWVKYYLWRSLGVRDSPYIVNHEQEYYHGTIYTIHLGWNLVHIHKTVKFDAKGRTTLFKVYPNQLKKAKKSGKTASPQITALIFWSLILISNRNFRFSHVNDILKVPLVSYAAVFCILTQSSLERSVAWRHWVGN